MGLISGIFSAAVKTVLTPVAIVKDAANVVVGNEPDSTKKLIGSALNDVDEAIDGLSEGNLL